MIEVIVDVNQLDKVKSELYKKLSEGLYKFAYSIYKEALRLTPMGATLRAISSLDIRKISDFHYKVGWFGLPYAKPLEFGSSPHFPPIQPLIPWVILRGLADFRSAESVAYAVAVSISKKGTKGKFMWKKIYQEKKREAKNFFK